MSIFITAIQSFIETIKDERTWVENLNECSRTLTKLYSQATSSEVNDSLELFAELLPDVPLVALGHVAITCGSLVEQGGNPEIAGSLLLQQLSRVNEAARAFYGQCRSMAESDIDLVEELRESATENAGDDIYETDLTPADIIEDHISEQGWQDLARRFGPRLFEADPTSVLGYMAEEYFRLGLVAHLSRSKELRKVARSRPELLEQTLKVDNASSAHRSFLATMLQVLDDEPMLVLHVEQRKGFDIRVSGIADNFQLHTLLAGSIIGSSADGLVAGEAPNKRAVAECRDQALGADGGECVTGAFDLWNWTGLQSDGSLRYEKPSHWIWGEGCPAEIISYEGRRVMLLGAPSYTRSWRTMRIFDAMVADLTIERKLSDSEVENWLSCLTQAAHLRPTEIGH